MLNSPKIVPHPKQDQIEKALDLVAALGGNRKDVNELLQEMLDVQTHNEKLYIEITNLKKIAEDTIKKAEQDTVAAKEKYDKLSREYSIQLSTINKGNEDFDKRKKLDAENYKKASEYLDERLANVEKAAKEVEEGFQNSKKTKEQLAKDFLAIGRRETDTNHREQCLNSVINELKTIMSKGI